MSDKKQGISDEIISPKAIAEILDTSSHNIRNNYKNKPNKSTFYKVLQLGAYCVKHDLKPKELVNIKKALDGHINGE